VAAGLVTPGQLRGPTWRRLFPDVYVRASVADRHEVRIRGAALDLPDGAVVSGRSAAHLWGTELASAVDPVEILTPRYRRPCAGLVIRRGSLMPDEIARTVPGSDAVGWIDALARRRRLTRDDLLRHAQRHWSEKGSRRAWTTLALCDPRAESPPESRLRFSIVRAGLPAPVPQLPILVRGRFIARVDLAWPCWRIALEYDGEWHADREQFIRDRRRIRALNAAGWYVYPVTSADMHDMDALIADIRAMLERVAGKIRASAT
jgi:hypothetical protein